MTQVLKPCLRQERQGRLRKASDGVEEELKARKDRAPRKMTEGKGQNTKKLREGCRIPWQTQADAEKLFGLLKMQNKACLGRHRGWGTLGTTQRGLEGAGSVVDCKAVEDSRGHGRPRKSVEGVADAEESETVEGVEGADDKEWQWQATGSRGLC
eukprot:gene15882-biopygen10971